MKQARVAVCGAKGRMGREAVKAISNEDGLQLVAEIDQGDDLALVIKEVLPHVVVDFTIPSAVFDNARCVIAAGCHPVIGTSGLSLDQIKELQQLCRARKLGGIVAPNFAIGAVLMIKFAGMAAKYFQDVEVIELHHAAKVDAPSATALRTVQVIGESRQHTPAKQLERESLPGARGAESEGIRVHSVRLPGLVAHQEVIFGGSGQSLTIRHDSLDRSSFMPGVCLACKKVPELHELVVGLEKIM